MITKSKKTKWGITRKVSVIPVLIIALFAFSVSSEKLVASINSNAGIEGVTQSEFIIYEDVNPWSPQNQLEEQIFIIAYGTYDDKDNAKNTPEIKYPASRKPLPKGVISYNDVEIKPEFKEKEIKKFICVNINYPVIALENGIRGEVIASYIINENGKIDNIDVEVSADQLLANEVTRVLKNLPDWTPGKQNGKNVPVQCYIFTKFGIQQ